MGNTRQEVAKALKVEDELIVEKVSIFLPLNQVDMMMISRNCGCFLIKRNFMNALIND